VVLALSKAIPQMLVNVALEPTPLKYPDTELPASVDTLAPGVTTRTRKISAT